MILDALIDALTDTAKTLPFLFAVFLLLEALEHYSGKFINSLLGRSGFAGPIFGAALGCIPQCGFSAAAANLYSGGVITLGTLMAVFLATSDEAVLIIMGHPGSAGIVGQLLLTKIVIGVIAGYLINFFFRKRKPEKHISDLCRNCGCSDDSGILKPALRHTWRLVCYLLIFSFVINLLLSMIGADNLAVFLGKGRLFQPFFTALIGLIPNCAASVMITELYLAGTLSFGSAVAGLSAGAGVGLAVLFRSNRHMMENVAILILLYLTAALSGLILSIAL